MDTGTLDTILAREAYTTVLPCAPRLLRLHWASLLRYQHQWQADDSS